MFFMWIIPIVLIGLLVYAIAGRNLGNVFRPASGRVCSHCRQPAQADWKVCPHCGQAP